VAKAALSALPYHQGWPVTWLYPGRRPRHWPPAHRSPDNRAAGRCRKSRATALCGSSITRRRRARAKGCRQARPRDGQGLGGLDGFAGCWLWQTIHGGLDCFWVFPFTRASPILSAASAASPRTAGSSIAPTARSSATVLGAFPKAPSRAVFMAGVPVSSAPWRSSWAWLLRAASARRKKAARRSFRRSAGSWADRPAETTPAPPTRQANRRGRAGRCRARRGRSLGMRTSPTPGRGRRPDCRSPAASPTSLRHWRSSWRRPVGPGDCGVELTPRSLQRLSGRHRLLLRRSPEKSPTIAG